MTTKTIDQQRFDELTEWCRNKPEEAAHRIIHAEDWEDSVHPEMCQKKKEIPTRQLPDFEIDEIARTFDGFTVALCSFDKGKDLFPIKTLQETGAHVVVGGATCTITFVDCVKGRFEAKTVRPVW